jgi:hypothetical protein
LFNRPIDPAEYVNEQQIDDFNIDLHKSIASPDKFSPGKRYDSLLPHYISPRKLKSQRKSYGFGYGTPSRFRRRNQGLVPSRTAIPDPIPAYRPRQTALVESFRSPRIRAATPPRTPASSNRSRVEQTRRNLSSQQSPSRRQINANQETIVDAVTEAVADALFNVSDRSNIFEDEDMPLVESFESPARSPENITRTPLQLNTPRSPDAPRRQRVGSARRNLNLAARGLNFDDSVKLFYRPLDREELANTQQIDDENFPLDDSILGPDTSFELIPSRTAIPDQSRQNTPPRRQTARQLDFGVTSPKSRGMINESIAPLPRTPRQNTSRRSPVREGNLVQITPEKSPLRRTQVYNDDSNLMQLSESEERMAQQIDELQQTLNESL